jgi:hypothetical protein
VDEERLSGVYPRCGCRDPVVGGRRGAGCSWLGEAGHGSWYFRLEVPRGTGGARHRVRRGGIPTKRAGRAGMALRRDARGDFIASCVPVAMSSCRAGTSARRHPPAGDGAGRHRHGDASHQGSQRRYRVDVSDYGSWSIHPFSLTRAVRDADLRTGSYGFSASWSA